MKILVHDYVGHPFQVHLSRCLARRGHHVAHVHFRDNPGPKGALTAQAGDPEGLEFVSLTLGGTVKQTAFVTRRFNDVKYGRKMVRFIEQYRPDVVISGNTPTEAQGAIIKACRSHGSRFVFWVQDVYGVAVSKLLAKKLGVVGKAVGWYFQMLDHRQFTMSDAVILITEGYKPEVVPWAGEEKVSVIENWASLDDIRPGDKNTSWTRSHQLENTFTYLYSGTLGRKHNPELLRLLAQTTWPRPHSVTVVGQGFGYEVLRDTPDRPQALKLLPLQPAEVFADVLASADVLVATIEADAGKFAVPSKIQSYLCAGRPILLAAPHDNLAAQTVIKADAGIVVEPTDSAGFIDAARLLFDNAELRATCSRNGRAYAERTFDIERITDQFEDILVNTRRQPA